jgi:hypothetical protein
MAFFFLLHTPGPADLELRGKVGRTQTGSFWRLPIGQRAVRVRRSGGVVRERGLGRWIAALASMTVLLISQLILAGFVLTATALNAAAQEAPKIEEAKGKPGELKLPDDLLVDTGKGGKKLRPPACDKCQDEWTALKAALTAYYAAQSLEGYQNSSKGQNFKDQEKAGNSGMKDILGMSDKEMVAARKDYNTAKKDPKKQNSVKPDALLKAINDALAALRKCEDEKCPKPEKPVEKKDEKKDDEKPVVTHWPGFDELPGNNESEDDIKKTVAWFKGIKLPDCSDDKEKTKKELEQLVEDAETAEVISAPRSRSAN